MFAISFRITKHGYAPSTSLTMAKRDVAGLENVRINQNSDNKDDAIILARTYPP